MIDLADWVNEPGKPVECGRCGQYRILRAKGLCPACYETTRRQEKMKEDPAFAERYRAAERAYYRDHPERRAEYQRSLPPEKKAIRRQQTRRYHDLHRDAIRDQRRNRSPEAKARSRAAERRWREAHPEQVAIHMRKYRHSHRELQNAHARNYKARKRGAQGSHTATDVGRIYAMQKGRCWWCNRSLRNAYHVDHRVPLSRGGGNGPDNLVISCQRCNDSKGARLPEEFAGRLF